MQIRNKGKYQSGQMGQTVNLLAFAFGGSNPSLPTNGAIFDSEDCAVAHLIMFFDLLKPIVFYTILFRSLRF